MKHLNPEIVAEIEAIVDRRIAAALAPPRPKLAPASKADPNLLCLIVSKAEHGHIAPLIALLEEHRLELTPEMLTERGSSMIVRQGATCGVTFSDHLPESAWGPPVAAARAHEDEARRRRREAAAKPPPEAA